jgi:hypothetical protein
MTDTAFFDRLDELAKNLMNKFGAVATLRVVTLGDVDANGDRTQATTDSPGVALRTETKALVDRLNKTYEAVLVYKGPAEAKIDNLLIHAGTTWKIIEAAQINPEGSRIMLMVVGVTKP